jgi:hypothetical protein
MDVGDVHFIEYAGEVWLGELSGFIIKKIDPFVIRGYPHSPFCFRKADDIVRGDVVFAVFEDDLYAVGFVIVYIQSVRSGDPDISVGRTFQELGIIVGERDIVFSFAERDEVSPVEAVESLGCCHPDKPVPVLFE